MKTATHAGVITALLLLASAGGCGGGPPPAPVKDLEFTQSMSSGRVSYDRGQIPQAVLLFDLALQRAEARDDAGDIGEAAYNLGVSLADDGQLERAAAILATARREFERAGQRTTDVKLVQAKLARRRSEAQEPAAGALASALATEVVAASDATPAERCQALTLLGELELEAGRVDAAARRLAEATRLLPSASGLAAGRSRDAMRAGLAGLEARLAVARGDHPAAAAAFDRQSDFARSAGIFGEMSGALLSAGKSYVAAGDHASGADRLFRAARSLIAQGERAEGIAAAREATTAADEAGDADLAARAGELITGAAPAPATVPGNESPAIPAPGPATRSER